MRFLQLAFITLMLAGPPYATGLHATELTGTLQKINDTGTMTLGVREHAFPFSYVEHGQPIGYAIDVCMTVVDQVRQALNRPGLQVQTRIVTPADRIARVAAGEIDLECSTTTNNTERQRQVAFSDTFFLSASRFVSRRGDHLTDIESLRNRTVASTLGTTNLIQLNQLNLALGLDMTVLEVPDTAVAFQMVGAGKADAFVMDDVQLSSLIARSANPGAYAISSDALSAAEPYGLVLRRDDPGFKAVVDHAVAGLLGSATGPALYAKWFQSPTPPGGINLHLPMSVALRHAFQHPSSSANPADYAE